MSLQFFAERVYLASGISYSILCTLGAFLAGRSLDAEILWRNTYHLTITASYSFSDNVFSAFNREVTQILR